MMTQMRRDLIFRVSDGCSEALLTICHWNNMLRCDEVLSWCIYNNITGKVFVDWIKIIHSRGVLNSYQFICSRIDKEKELKPIIAGRDYF